MTDLEPTLSVPYAGGLLKRLTSVMHAPHTLHNEHPDGESIDHCFIIGKTLIVATVWDGNGDCDPEAHTYVFELSAETLAAIAQWDEWSVSLEWTTEDHETWMLEASL